MSDMEVTSLPDASSFQLSALFREEGAHWKKQLFWDYGQTLELVERLVASRALPGFVLRDGNEVVGYSYFVVDRPVGFIGGLYILDSHAALANYHQLIKRLVVTMCGLDEMQRIESQVMPFNVEFSPIFVSLGFEALPRYFLTASMGSKQVLEKVELSEKVESYSIQAWQPQFLMAATEVICDSYVESPDAVLCRDYQSRKGCTRFLRNLIESPTCGRFSRQDTRVVQDQSGKICGVLIATKINGDTGMVPQLSIRRDCQGKGLGSWLLAEYMRSAALAGLKRVSLSVSQANKRAFKIYQRFGFQIEKEFHALIWNRDV